MAQPRSITIRHPQHTFLHLTLSSVPTIGFLSNPKDLKEPPDIDILTVRRCLSSALQQYLGLTGVAIAIDILKIEGRNCWIRIPREDGMAVISALGQWTTQKDEGMTWRIRGHGEWLCRVAAGNGEILFES